EPQYWDSPTAAGRRNRRRGGACGHRTTVITLDSALCLPLRAVLVEGRDEGKPGGLHDIGGRRPDRNPAARRLPLELDLSDRLAARADGVGPERDDPRRHPGRLRDRVAHRVDEPGARTLSVHLFLSPGELHVGARPVPRAPGVGYAVELPAGGRLRHARPLDVQRSQGRYGPRKHIAPGALSRSLIGPGLRTGPPSRSPPPNSGPSPCRPRSWLFLSLDALSATAAGLRAGPLWGGGPLGRSPGETETAQQVAGASRERSSTCTSCRPSRYSPRRGAHRPTSNRASPDGTESTGRESRYCK